MDISKIKTPFVYSTEMYNSEKKEWKEPEKRFYVKEQNVIFFPNNNMRRNFKKL